MRDITLTDGASAARAAANRPSEPADSEPALDITGVLPARSSQRRSAPTGGDSLAAALRSYCEESES